jgi:hypothetical protein
MSDLKAVPKTKRRVNKPYIEWIKQRRCCVCDQPAPSDPHHVNEKGKGSMGSKTHDDRALPFCRPCHTEVHLSGCETFAKEKNIDFEIKIEVYKSVFNKVPLI